MGAGTVSRSNRWGSHRGVRRALHSGMETDGGSVRVGQRRLSRSRMGFGALLSLGTLLATYTPTSPEGKKLESTLPQTESTGLTHRGH